MKVLLGVCFIFLFNSVHAQVPTVGLSYHNGMAEDGYTLFAPEQGLTVYLIDNCGAVVNEWLCSGPPGLSCYLLENGNLLFSGIDNIEMRSWDNTLLWNYSMTINGIAHHHDIEPLPNGNVLVIVKDGKTIAELVAAGRDPNLIDVDSKMDRIVEIEPNGLLGGTIVWEWRFWDHLVQDFDNTKPNFDVVTDHPELININFDQNFPNDLTHVNSIDYNDSLDQILISSRNYSEIYIIDHSTTTLEAESHLGGNAGQGGDFLWRWGNTPAYGFGTSVDQQLFGQHDARWVEDGYLNDGKISVFNNGGDGTGSFSSVHLLQPQMTGFNYNFISNTFAPTDYDFTWNGDAVSPTIYSTKKCGAVSLPLGGFMICESATGQIIEINEDKDSVWMYRSPVTELGIAFQFSDLNGFNNQMFRATKYPFNFPGFIGNDLTPTGPLENANTLTESCILGIQEDAEVSNFQIVNPVMDGQIEFIKAIQVKNVQLLNLKGEIICEWNGVFGQILTLPDLSKGVYIVRIPEAHFQERIIIL